jgi:5-hydroxyisourate hydrolase-like protein (transthyretin family)
MTHKLQLIDDAHDGGTTTAISFAQEENKKSSFILEQCPVSLCASNKALNDSANSENHTQKPGLSASASISCSISDSDETATYLFGGYEIVASTKSIEVYVAPSDNAKTTTTAKKSENYITTCKGIPIRDEDDEKDGHVSWYKFIFVLPGGPKPVFHVRLKFVRTCTTASDPSSDITIRTLKLKGRLQDTSASTKTQSQGRTNRMQMSATHANNVDSGDSMASMMAQMKLNAMAQGMPMMMPFSQTLSMQFPQQQQQQHQTSPQNNREEADKNQAEIISSIAGLGMFLKS